MKPGRPSVTATHNAFLRACEAVKPADRRICRDALARRFLTGRLRVAFRNPILRHQILATWEALAPGVCAAILARTRFMDECLRSALACGTRQVVILGAGYDTRAYRMDALKTGVAVFELDHHDTQAWKLRMVERIFRFPPAHVAYVPIRFDRDRLADRLAAHGYDRRARTLFIWEGVTYYLPLQVVEETLRFIADASGPGGSVVFDSLPPSVADGTCDLPEARGVRKSLRMLGESLMSGIAPDGMAAFLASVGLAPVTCVRAGRYLEQWFRGEGRKRSATDLFQFVHAIVHTKAGAPDADQSMRIERNMP